MATTNPFRPGAGHSPPFLAGRETEAAEFTQLLEQGIILKNFALTGLRGAGKTVLLESLRAIAAQRGWRWVGADLSESTSISEDHLAIRLCTDLSLTTSTLMVPNGHSRPAGFTGAEVAAKRPLDYAKLASIHDETPGLSVDKVKAVLEAAWAALARTGTAKGVVFAYDEAQNLADHAQKEQYPLSLLLDTFQSVQRKGLPLMLALTGLPTLVPKLVDARTYAERMFRVVFLESLAEDESRQAIVKPIERSEGAVKLSEQSVDAIVRMSGGYPYFLQFIGKEVYDAFVQRADRGAGAEVPIREIEQKLDTDFFAGRWARATDRQRELMIAIAHVDADGDEFSVAQIVEQSRRLLGKPFSPSHATQMLAALSNQGLVFKNRHGRYAFAVPLLQRYILRQLRQAHPG